MKFIIEYAARELRLLTAVVFLGAGMSSAANAEDFGRFFTTPMQRQYLDQLKARGTPIVVKVEDDLNTGEKKIEKKEVVNDALTVKGLVYRKDGKSAAWLNDSNTFEGDVAWEYAGVKEEKITSSKVKIRVGDQNKDINLKVGEKYEPATESVKDIIQEPGSKISVKHR